METLFTIIGVAFTLFLLFICLGIFFSILSYSKDDVYPLRVEVIEKEKRLKEIEKEIEEKEVELKLKKEYLN